MCSGRQRIILMKEKLTARENWKLCSIINQEDIVEQKETYAVEYKKNNKDVFFIIIYI